MVRHRGRGHTGLGSAPDASGRTICDGGRGRPQASGVSVEVQQEQEVGKVESPPSPWAESRAKARCRELLLDPNSYVHGMPASHVYWTDGLFQRHDQNRFVANFNNLKNTIEKERLAIKFDQLSLDKEKAAFPRNPLTNRGNPFWDTHPAKKKLIEELKRGDHEGKTPNEIHVGIYKDFPAAVFRNHFYQERRRLREAVFWQVKRNRKGQKKHEEETSRIED